MTQSKLIGVSREEAKEQEKVRRAISEAMVLVGQHGTVTKEAVRDMECFLRHALICYDNDVKKSLVESAYATADIIFRNVEGLMSILLSVQKSLKQSGIEVVSDARRVDHVRQSRPNGS